MTLQRLSLPQVTLCCVDTRSPAEAVYALRRSMSHIDFGRVLYLGPAHARDMGLDLRDIELVAIEDITSIEAYSRFMLQGLGPYIQTSHVLVIQWDGFVTHPELWQDQFLDYDYIGPPWYKKNQSPEVGNGGFSLRTRRLIDALALLPYDGSDPEDVAICVRLRDQLQREHNIQFAPIELARAFGVEYGKWQPAFGFHGMHNFAYEMTSEQLQNWLKSTSNDMLLSKHARKLIKNLMANRNFTQALALIHRRSDQIGWTLDQCNLYLRARGNQLKSTLPGLM